MGNSNEASEPLLTHTPQNEFKTSDGFQIKYIDTAKPSQQNGDVVLLIHALTTSTVMFQTDRWVTPIINGLIEDGFRVIAMDCRGHGLSDKPKDSKQYGLKMVKDQVELLDELKIKSVHVAGYSMGAEIGIKLCTSYPDRVLSLCVYGTGWSYGTEWYNKSYGSFINPCSCIGCICISIRCCWYPCCCCWIIPCINYNEPDTNFKALMAVCKGMEEIMYVTQQDLEKIDVPVIGIVGEKDEELKYVKRMEIIKDFSMTVIPNKGHMDGWGDDIHQDTFIQFFKRVRASSK
eukprot:463423_1